MHKHNSTPTRVTHFRPIQGPPPPSYVRRNLSREDRFNNTGRNPWSFSGPRTWNHKPTLWSLHNRLCSAGSRILELTKLVKDLEDDNRRVSKIVNILEGRILILELNAPTKDQQSTQEPNQPFDSPGSLFDDGKSDIKREPASPSQYTCMMADAKEGMFRLGCRGL